MSIKRIISKLRSIPLWGKLMLVVIFTGIIPVCIAGIVFGGRLYDMMTASSISNSQNATEEITPLIASEANGYKEVMDRLLATDLGVKLFGGEFFDSFNTLKNEFSIEEFSAEISNITYGSNIKNVRIYSDLLSEELGGSGKGSEIFEREDKIRGTYWHGIFNGKPNFKELYCPPFYLSNREINELGDSALVSKQSVRCDGKITTAYIVLYYSSDVFSRMIQVGAGLSESVVYIINERDALVACTDQTLSGLYRISFSDAQELKLKSNSMVMKTVAEKDVYISINYIDRQKWFVITVIPSEPIRRETNTLMLEFIGVIVLCVAIALLLGIFQIFSVVKRIQEVEKRMRLSRQSAPVALPPPTIHDDVGSLVDSYNYMTGQINALLEARANDAEDLRLAEFNSLQAQINPHFLYNTMDMINWMALQGKNEEVSETVQELAQFYRLTLSRKKPYSTIADETKHAKIYVSLQNRRFGNSIEFIVDIPDELSEYRIPRLTFQPILENSILHGILGQEEKSGTIVLTAWESGDDIDIVISDDGKGMEPGELASILSEDRKGTSSGTNIAVYNIHRRLQLLYGSAYGLHYRSNPGEGCEVTIHIPKHLGDTKYQRPD